MQSENVYKGELIGDSEIHWKDNIYGFLLKKPELFPFLPP